MSDFDDFDGVEEFYKGTLRKLKSDIYDEFVLGVVSTNKVDIHGDQMSLEALKSTEIAINKHGLPLNAHHDPRIATFGRTLAAKMLTSRDGEKNYVFAVIATYSKSFYRPFPTEMSALNSGYIPTETDVSFGDVEIEYSNIELDEDIITSALANAPEFVATKPHIAVRKAADPVTILSIAIPASIALPFLTGYFNKLGEQTANHQERFASWLVNSIVKKVNKRVLYNFNTPYRGCLVEFIIETNSPVLIKDSINQITDASNNAKKLIDNLIDESPKRLVYVYHNDDQMWVPEHVTLGSGQVLTDRPYLMSMEEFGGLSIGARIAD